MDGIVLQNWTTVLADAGSVTSVTQPAVGWLDLPEFDDVVLFLEVRQITGTVQMNYQTSPSQDDASFQAIVAAFNMAASTSPRVDMVYAAFAALPLARFLRWQLSTTQGSGPWSATFRITAAAYGPRA